VAVDKGVAYVGSDDHRLYAIDMASGLGMWSFATGGEVRSSPLVHGGQVYAGSHDGNLYAVDALSGWEKGRFTTGAWIDSSPCTDGTALYLGDWDRWVTALEMGPLDRR
jgi:outer membrane protein assembly factor BamB